MILQRKQHYFEMLNRGRLVPFIRDNRLIAFITFYITNNKEKYINADPWDVLDDNAQGDTCYINQLMSNTDPQNPRLSYGIWHDFKKHIKENFSNVKNIHWRRWDKKNFKVREYTKEL